MAFIYYVKLSILSLPRFLLIPTCSVCSLHGPYKVSTYLVSNWSPIWFLCGPDSISTATMWSLHGLPGPNIWSLTCLCLIHLWSLHRPSCALPGSHMVPIILCVPYVTLHGHVPIRPFPGPCLVLPTWSLPISQNLLYGYFNLVETHFFKAQNPCSLIK
jgi:hypothetical protein